MNTERSGEFCLLCKRRSASIPCRRCGLPICSSCHYHHGLCRRCARALGRLA